MKQNKENGTQFSYQKQDDHKQTYHVYVKVLCQNPKVNNIHHRILKNRSISSIYNVSFLEW